MGVNFSLLANLPEEPKQPSIIGSLLSGAVSGVQIRQKLQEQNILNSMRQMQIIQTAQNIKKTGLQIQEMPAELNAKLQTLHNQSLLAQAKLQQALTQMPAQVKAQNLNAMVKVNTAVGEASWGFLQTVKNVSPDKIPLLYQSYRKNLAAFGLYLPPTWNAEAQRRITLYASESKSRNQIFNQHLNASSDVPQPFQDPVSGINYVTEPPPNKNTSAIQVAQAKSDITRSAAMDKDADQKALAAQKMLPWVDDALRLMEKTHGIVGPIRGHFSRLTSAEATQLNTDYNNIVTFRSGDMPASVLRSKVGFQTLKASKGSLTQQWEAAYNTTKRIKGTTLLTLNYSLFRQMCNIQGIRTEDEKNVIWDEIISHNPVLGKNNQFNYANAEAWKQYVDNNGLRKLDTDLKSGKGLSGVTNEEAYINGQWFTRDSYVKAYQKLNPGRTYFDAVSSWIRQADMAGQAVAQKLAGNKNIIGGNT